MATSATLKVLIKGRSEADTEFVEFRLKENEGLSQENQVETYKELNDPEIAIWDLKLLTGKSWSSGGTILLTDDAREDVVKLREIYKSADPFVTIRWALDGTDAGKDYRTGDAIITSLNVTSGTGTVPMAAFSLQGTGPLTDGVFA